MKKILSAISIMAALTFMVGCQTQKQSSISENVTIKKSNSDSTEKEEKKIGDESKQQLVQEDGENIISTQETEDCSKEQVTNQGEGSQTDLSSKNSPIPQANSTTSKKVESKVQVESKNNTQQEDTSNLASTPASMPTSTESDNIKAESEKSVVTLSIYSDDSTILAPMEVKVEEGETVFDVLNKTVKDQKIQMEYSGKAETVYVEGINNIYEFDKGSGSGWMYNVNGVYPNKSAGAYVLKAGDSVEWHYTLDLGKDLGVEVSK